ENRPEWTVADLAVQTVGAATVGVYTTSSSEQLLYYLEHSQSVGLILEDAEQLEKWLAIAPQCANVRWVIVIEPEVVPGVDRWDAALATGAELYEADPAAVDSRLAA